MNKLQPKILKYYDYDEAIEYLGWSPEKNDVFWDWICETHSSNLNGFPVRVSNWEIIYKNGKFLSFLNECGVTEMVKEITDRLGDVVLDSETEGEKELTLIKNW